MLTHLLLPFVLAASGTVGPHAAAAKPLSEDAATSLVIEHFKKFGKKLTPIKIECVDFTAEPEAKKMFVIAREKHGGKCGGDENVTPTIATFEVINKKVFVQDPLSDKPIPFDAKFKGLR